MSKVPSNETIEKAKKGLAERRPSSESQDNNGEVDLRSYLVHYGVSIIKEKGNGKEKIFVLKECPFNPEHNRGEAHVQIGTDGKLGFRCKHNSCASYRWQDVRAKISGTDSLSQFMTGYTPTRMNSYRSSDSAPTMGDLRLYLDMNIEPGQTFTTKDLCHGLGAHNRNDKKIVYARLSELAKEGLVRRDKYRQGCYRRVLEMEGYDLDGEIEESPLFDVTLCLDLHNLINIEPNQIAAISGRYDAGKSSFLFQLMELNYRDYKIVHFSSPEWGLNAIKERMDELGIPRPHENVKCYPMTDGYEDLIPQGPCIVLVDYLRTNDSPYEIDRQYHRIFQNLNGGVAFTAIQKHPFIDKPTGGQFAVHAPQHVILLDQLKDSAYICKIFKSKNEKSIAGLYRVFGFKEGRRLVPYMKDWKKGEIKWNKSEEDKPKNDTNDTNDTKKDSVITRGPCTDIDINKEREKEKRTKKEKEKEDPEVENKDQAPNNDFKEDISKNKEDAQGQVRLEI